MAGAASPSPSTAPTAESAPAAAAPSATAESPRGIHPTATIANHRSVPSVHRLIEIRVPEFAFRALDTETKVCVVNAFLLLFGMLQLAMWSFFAESTVVPRAFGGVVGGARVLEGAVRFVALSLPRDSIGNTRIGERQSTSSVLSKSCWSAHTPFRRSKIGKRASYPRRIHAGSHTSRPSCTGHAASVCRPLCAACPSRAGYTVRTVCWLLQAPSHPPHRRQTRPLVRSRQSGAWPNAGAAWWTPWAGPTRRQTGQSPARDARRRPYWRGSQLVVRRAIATSLWQPVAARQPRLRPLPPPPSPPPPSPAE